VALVHFMRPSLRKGAHAALSSAAWQEIRVRSGRDDNSSWKLILSVPKQNYHPERSRISCFTALLATTYVVLPKENHMQDSHGTLLPILRDGNLDGNLNARAHTALLTPSDG
jgi:hypothetical protein